MFIYNSFELKPDGANKIPKNDLNKVKTNDTTCISEEPTNPDK